MTPSTASRSTNLVANSTQSALMEGLSPALRSTLSSLNINLDYELTRYRYAKRGEAQPSLAAVQFRARQTKTSLDLINVSRSGSQPRVPDRRGVIPPPPPNPRIQRIASPPGMTEGKGEVAALRSAIVQQSAAPQTDYMTSSEALLQNFNESSGAATAASAATVRPARSRSKTWLTPLGLGALLLLLVTSAGFGFLLVNPTAASNLFQQTPLARFFPSAEDDETAATDGQAEMGEAPTSDLDEPPLTVLSPDLSQQEFSELDLNTLSTLPSGSTPALTTPDLSTQQGPRSPAASDEPTAGTGPRSPSAPQRVNQIPVTTTPAPLPAAPVYRSPAPAPVTAPTPGSSGSAQPQAQPSPPAAPTASTTASSPQSAYYVVTDYTGDPSLDEARTAVQDAYVRNFDMGARIQMGAFNTPEGAAALTEELRDQGIEAEVYEP